MKIELSVALTIQEFRWNFLGAIGSVRGTASGALNEQFCCH